jgi:hypothetical protein
MTTQERVIVEALNIASTIHRHPEHGYEATAEQIRESLTDPRLIEDYQPHLLVANPRAIARHLVAMAGNGNPRNVVRAREGHALVEQHRRGRWRLTDRGLEVLGA